MVLVIDNYDSFTYNLVQYLGELSEKKEIKIFRHDEITIKEIRKLNPEQIIISPGPGHPQNAGISCQVVRELMGEYPILGVCLGHQCIVHELGGKIIQAEKMYHGKTSQIFYQEKDKCLLFKNLSQPFNATRYHSLTVEPESLPDNLNQVAWTQDDEVMAVKHKEYELYGVQFHPESILTDGGKLILKNFLLASKKEVK